MFSFNSVNSCRFTGNVGKEPVAKTFGEGDKKHEVVNFSVAVRQYNSKDPKKPGTMWINAAVYGERDIKMVKEWVKKGSIVEVEGELNVRTYQANDGSTGTSIDLRANNIIVLGGKKDGEGQGGSSNQSAAAPAQNGTTAAEIDDDIPF